MEAIKLNLEQALAAAERGECLACRIGARHTGPARACPKARWWDFYWDAKAAFQAETGLDLDNHVPKNVLLSLFDQNVGAMRVVQWFQQAA